MPAHAAPSAGRESSVVHRHHLTRKGEDCSWVTSPTRILIADDEPANVRLLELLLEQAGYRCCCASRTCSILASRIASSRDKTSHRSKGSPSERSACSREEVATVASRSRLCPSLTGGLERPGGGTPSRHRASVRLATRTRRRRRVRSRCQVLDSDRWRGIPIGESAQRQLRAIRARLCRAPRRMGDVSPKTRRRAMSFTKRAATHLAPE